MRNHIFHWQCTSRLVKQLQSSTARQSIDWRKLANRDGLPLQKKCIGTKYKFLWWQMCRCRKSKLGLNKLKCCIIVDKTRLFKWLAQNAVTHTHTHKHIDDDEDDKDDKYSWNKMLIPNKIWNLLFQVLIGETLKLELLGPSNFDLKKKEYQLKSRLVWQILPNYPILD